MIDRIATATHTIGLIAGLPESDLESNPTNLKLYAKAAEVNLPHVDQDHHAQPFAL